MSADITQAQEVPVFELYEKQDGDILKENKDWDDIRQRFSKLNKKESINPENCKKCVWANKESGKVFCSRYKCTGGKNYV